MEGTSESLFPIEIRFERGKSIAVVYDLKHLLALLHGERATWMRIANSLDSAVTGHQRVQVFVQDNIDRIKVDIHENSEDHQIMDAVNSVKSEYLPVSVGAGRILSDAFNMNPTIGTMAILYYLGDAPAPINHSNSSAFAIATLAVSSENFTSPEKMPLGMLKEASALQIDVSRQNLELADFIRNRRDEWQDLRTTIASELALRAPRMYWKTKARYHRDKSRQLRKAWDQGTLLTGLGLLVATVWVFSSWFPISPGAASEVHQWIASILSRVLFLGTASGIAVWYLRHLMRDQRFHENLAQDAAERSTMVETYAAMKAAGLEAGDLATVLTPLFRSASGATGEDHAPVFPIELVLKAVNDLGKRP